MAAWQVVSLVLGVWIIWGLVMAWGFARFRAYVDSRLVAADQEPVQTLNDELLSKLVDRLIDTTLPAASSQTRAREADNDGPHDPGELDDSEWAGARDWTDNLFGEERSTVGRLAPGESPIPTDPVARWRAMGDGAFDEWADSERAREAVGGESWVAPIDLGNGEMVE